MTNKNEWASRFLSDVKDIDLDDIGLGWYSSSNDAAARLVRLYRGEDLPNFIDMVRAIKNIYPGITQRMAYGITSCASREEFQVILDEAIQLAQIEPKPIYPTVVLVIGVSGAGKTTLANRLVETGQCRRVSFPRPMKTYIETGYGLEPGELDTQAGKAKIVPGTNKTFLQVLIESYHWHCESMPDITGRFAVETIKQMAKVGKVAVNDDCRSIHEVESLMAAGFCLVPIYLFGRGEVMTSDQKCLDILQLLGERGYYFHGIDAGQYSLDEVWDSAQTFLINTGVLSDR